MHNTLALVVLHTDLTSQRTESKRTHTFTYAVSNAQKMNPFPRFDECIVRAVNLSLYHVCIAPGMFKHSSSGLVSSTSLLPLHPDVNTLLFKPEGQPYLMEVSHTHILRYLLVYVIDTICAMEIFILLAL